MYGKNFLIYFLVALSSALQAAHIVGGEINYNCVGNNQYEMVLTVFRDCNSAGANFDAPANITIFNSNGGVYMVRQVFFSTRARIPNIPPNNCTQLPNTVCTERAVYRDTVYLPPTAGGYTLSYQRCCRNASISNVPNSDDWGSTYTTSIPGNDNSCNSSPSFTKLPPTVLCLNVPVKINLGATDADGDSLRYFLCSPFHGGGKQAGTGFNSPKPDTALPPTYTKVPFRPGFSTASPIPSQPPVTLNSNNGQLTIRPSQVGQYVFAICVSEVRNGRVLSTIRRDFQFNVSGSCQGTTAFIEQQPPTDRCNGTGITFSQKSINASSYLWDFGDPNNAGDTSRMPNPTYQYSDTGRFTVTLIANPRSSCPDTTERLFEVYDSLLVDFDFQEDACFDSHVLNFTASGNFSPNANFTWNFAGQTNQGRTTTVRNPSNIRYNQPGSYIITLTVNDFACQGTASDTLVITERPKLDHVVPTVQGCQPVEVSFTDQSTGIRLRHMWDFGDGFRSRKPSPTHVYDSVGTFTVRHTIWSTFGCLDTIQETFTNRIEVWPVPEVTTEVSPQVAEFDNATFTVKNSYTGDVNFSETFLPNGQRLKNLDSTTFTLENDTGKFQVVTITRNEYGCADTSFIPIRVKQPLLLKIPNAFTPNHDGLNDEFSYALSGVRSHRLLIYNRWGELVFSSSDVSKKWDGIDKKSGKPVPSGVYTYRLRARTIETNRDIKKVGTVTVIR